MTATFTRNRICFVDLRRNGKLYEIHRSAAPGTRWLWRGADPEEAREFVAKAGWSLIRDDSKKDTVS